MTDLTPKQMALSILASRPAANAMEFALEVVRHISKQQAEDAVASWRSARVSESGTGGVERTVVVIQAVTKHYGVTDSEMRSRRQYKRVTQARHMCWSLLRLRLGLSWSDIGDRYDRDHTTVLTAVKKLNRASMEWLTLNALLSQREAPEEVVEAAE